MKRNRIKRAAWAALAAAALAAAVPAAALFGPKGDSPEEKRATVLGKRDAILEDLYRHRPELWDRLPEAPGYATFSSLSTKLLLTSSANGYGVVVDNETGRETFMRMASFGVGAGVGIKDQRMVIIFHDRGLMNRFVEKGWQFGAQSDAGVMVKGDGAAAGLSASASSGGTGASAQAGTAAEGQEPHAADALAPGQMEIYQFTESGLALSATVSGTKYWKDSKLNG